MARTVKFTIEGDASSLLAENRKVIQSQGAVEKSIGQTASAAESATKRMAQAVESYDLAEGRNGSVRTRSASARVRRAQAYGVAPQAMAARGSAGVARFQGAAGLYETKEERNARAASIRSSRVKARQAAAEEQEFRGFVQDRNVRTRWRREETAARLRGRRDRVKNFFSGGDDLLPGLSTPKLAAMALAVKGYQAVGAAISSTFDRSQEMVRENVAFQDQMTGLAGLGGNALGIGALKSRVFGTAIARGVNRQEVIDSIYQLQSTASNLPQDVQTQIFQQAGLLTKVKGGSMAQNQTALVKMWQNFPGSFKSPKEAANFLGAVEEKGSIDMSQLAETAPDVFASWKEAGYSLKDLAAAIQVTTSYTGDVNATMVQLRNAPTRMLNALKVLGKDKKGNGEDFQFKSTDYVERMEQIGERLDKMPPDKRAAALKKIYKDEGMITGSVLESHVGELRQQRQDFSTVGENYLFDKYRQRMADPAYLSAEISKSVLELQNNIPAMAAQEGQSMRNTESYEALRAGLMWTNRNSPWVTKESIENSGKAMAVAGAAMPGGIDRIAETKLGFGMVYDKMVEASGQAPDRQTARQMRLQAELLKVRHSRAFDLKDADDTDMDEGDVQEMLGLYGQGLSPTAGQLREYHRLGGASNPAAAGWLRKAAGAGADSGPGSPFANDPNWKGDGGGDGGATIGDFVRACGDILHASKILSSGALDINAHI